MINSICKKKKKINKLEGNMPGAWGGIQGAMPVKMG